MAINLLVFGAILLGIEALIPGFGSLEPQGWCAFGGPVFSWALVLPLP